MKDLHLLRRKHRRGARRALASTLLRIDIRTAKLLKTIHLGKRPRGIHASPDGKTLYVALSGTPIAVPDVDESTSPPPDHSADGIGVFDVATQKLVKVISGGSDPENFDISQDGKTLYLHEDISSVSIVDINTGQVERSLQDWRPTRRGKGPSRRKAGLRYFGRRK